MELRSLLFLVKQLNINLLHGAHKYLNNCELCKVSADYLTSKDLCCITEIGLTAF